MSLNNVSVVLVHGAWADGSSWSKVTGPLRAEGARVVATPLPLTSLDDDVAALDRTLERIEGRISVKVGRPLWKDRPSWFLVAEQDRMIIADTQRFMAERMKAKVRSQPVDHTPIVTAPGVVVDIIRDATRAAAAIRTPSR